MLDATDAMFTMVACLGTGIAPWSVSYYLGGHVAILPPVSTSRPAHKIYVESPCREGKRYIVRKIHCPSCGCAHKDKWDQHPMHKNSHTIFSLTKLKKNRI